jgi:uncharacterized protein YcbK (DUF882 family)
MRFGARLLASFALATLSLAAAEQPARADVKHVVARGHTLEAIAHRYHVTTKAILEANHMKDADRLKVGETLIVPGVTATAAKPSAKDQPGSAAAGKNAKAAEKKKPAKPVTYAMRARTPGVIHVSRLATSEDFTVRVADRRGRTSPTALKSFERLLRSAGGQGHPIDARLVSLVAVVSDHFGSRKLEVISGYRPFSPSQHTAHSNHNEGKAMDFRVVGVPNEVLRDYCRTLRNVGVGYYPNSTFVHLDVRALPAFWIDYSKPGESPRYNSPNVEADEGTSDVGEEVHAAIGSPTMKTSAPPAAGSDAPASSAPPAGSGTTAPVPTPSASQKPAD